jgi:hypothetical protein
VNSMNGRTQDIVESQGRHWHLGSLQENKVTWTS